MERITINGHSYPAKELDFNFLCELDEAGIQVTDIGNKIMSVIRVYAAFCMGTSHEIAGNEINQHVINGGELKDVIDVFGEKAENSGFFQAINKTTQAKTTEGNPKKTTAKKA